MSGVVQRASGHWHRRISSFDLVAARLVVAGIVLGLHPWERYTRVGRLPESLWDPVPLVSWLGLPRPDIAAATSLANLTITVTLLVGLGVRPVLTSAVLAALLLVQEAFVVSAGRVSHGTIPLLYAVAFLPVAHATRPRSGWYVDVVYLELATFYGGAGLSKLLDAGWRWTDGYSLQFFLLEKGVPEGQWLAAHLDLCHAASIAVLVWELAFVLGMIPRLRVPMLAGGVAFHAGTTWFLGVTFWPVVALYALFVPWGTIARRAERLYVAYARG